MVVKRFWRIAIASLFAPRRSSGSNEIPNYLKDTTVTTSDFAAGQAYLNSLGKELPNAAKQGIETYNGYSPEDKADVTLVPEDGQ